MGRHADLTLDELLAARLDEARAEYEGDRVPQRSSKEFAAPMPDEEFDRVLGEVLVEVACARRSGSLWAEARRQGGAWGAALPVRPPWF